jgi:4-amino-4-deoxy-L-arabinose transferase-like glycosyltransferase
MKNSKPYYIIVFGLFLGICAPTLWSDGMFMDGLYYAAISRNLASGLGSFWFLHFTDFSYPIFYEHPPLAMGLQSIFFYVFGDNIYIERFYAFFTFIVIAYIIHLIWGEINRKGLKYLSWVPLLFWVIIPLNSWAYSNNMLENTMNIFVSLSVLFSLKSFKSKKLKNIFFAGTFLSLAFLSKGFVGLFPLSIFFWHFIVFKKMNIKEMFSRSAQLFLFTITPFILLYLFYPIAINSIVNYIHKQVFGSIQNISTVESRFFIIEKLILELLPALVLCLIIFYFSVKKKFKVEHPEKKWMLFFFLLGLSGVLPIMISMKQSSFYILTTFPFFSVAFGILVAPFIASVIPKETFKIFLLGIFILIGSIFFSVKQIGVIGRDHELVKDIQLILDIIPKNSAISIDENMRKNYSLIGYFARYGNVSLNKKEKLNYHISYKVNNEDKENYEKIDVNTQMIELYSKK